MPNDTRSKLAIRPYQEGDEEAISGIFQRCYSAYSGFPQRTPDFWRWFNLERPSSAGEGTLVATLQGHPVGALTLSEHGNIIDPCYDPSLDGRMIVKLLLEQAEVMARKQGFKRITLVVPFDDPRLTGACTDLRMRGKRSDARFIISVGNLERLLPIVLKKNQVPEGSYLLSVRVKDGSQRHTLLTASHGDISAMRAKEDAVADLRVRIDEATLNGLVFSGRLGARDVVMGRVRVRPAVKLRAGLALLKCLNLDSRWFVPRGGTI